LSRRFGGGGLSQLVLALHAILFAGDTGMPGSAGAWVSRLHVVLGAGGGIGGAVVRELAGRGVEVRAVSRRADAPVLDGVTRRAADVATTAGAAAACQGAAVVYHCVQPPYDRWAEQFRPLNRAVADAVGDEGAKLVYADNLYMYEPIAGPITEKAPQQPSSRKGRLRKELAEEMLAAHAAGRLRVAIGQAADYYGPGGGNSIAGDTFFGAAVAGKSVRWPANADQSRSFGYLPDIARGLVTLGERDAADGRAWVFPTAPPLTARALAEMVGRDLGRHVKLVVTSKPAMRLAGLFIPQARELPDIWYQFSVPFTVDGSSFETAFGGFGPTAHEQAVHETVAWFRSHAAGV
jgi:nucleoside-diphosphate-sugar epimerase